MNLLQKASRTFLFQQQAKRVFSTQLTMATEESKHRMKLPLYDLEPQIEQCFIAPNSTVVGEVRIRRYSSVWYNCVVRGDINRVDIHNFSSIGDGTVIHTAAALPTGMSANVYIGRNCTIGRGCTIYSAHIEDDVTVGDKCIILEGARIEKSAQIAPGSVVPPGRLIPAKQLWGGNPVVYIKDLNIGEVWANYTKSYVEVTLGDAHKNEFTLWNSAYLERESSANDVEPAQHELQNMTVARNYYKGVVKYYV